MAIQKLFTSLSKAATGGTYVGEAGRLFYDPAKGLRVSDGVTPGGAPIAIAVTAANIGDLVITGGSISTINPNEDLSLASNGTGNVNVYGSFKVHTDGTNSSISFDVNPNGFTTINIPTLGTGNNGLLINGGTQATMTLPQVAGTTLRLVGNDGVSNTMAIDAFGTGTFPGTINRAGRGTSATPTATKTGDTIGRWGAVGYGDTNFVIDQGLGRAASDIRFIATEDFTDTQGGTQIQFYTSPNGGTQRTLSVTMDYTGITTGNIYSTNVFVSGNTISQGTTQMIGNIIAQGTTTLVGNVIMNADFTIDGNTVNTGTTINVGTTQAIGNFTANGTSNLIGEVTTQGNLSVVGNLFIEGTSINTGTTSMIGNTTTIGTTTLTGDVHISGNVDTTGASASFGTSTFTGQVDILGPMSINNQISVTATGNIKFNDGSVQTTAAVQTIDNSNHVTGSFNTIGAVRHLQLTTDATPANTPSTIVSRSATGDIAVGNITATNLSTTSISGNTSIAGSMIVYGNLQVVGTTTSVNSTQLSITSLTLTVANNAVTSSQADTAAFLVGTNGEFADWTFDNVQHAWRSNVSLVPATSLDGESLGSPTRQWGNVYAGEAYFSNKLNVGVTPLIDYTTVAQFTSNVNDFSQVYAQNLSSNASASTDFVAGNDISGSTNNYIDMGINSSTYTDAAYTIQSANDGYLYVNGGNLTIGTQSTGSDLVFFTDGTLAANEAGRIHLKRWILGGTDNGTDKLQVAGTASISGNLTAGNVSATNLTSQFTTLYATAATQANQITGANAAIVTANTALKAYTDNQITTANTGMKSYVDGQVTTINSSIQTLNANVGAYELFANANVSGLQNQITGANTNIATGVTNFNTLNANVGAFETYANATFATSAAVVTANTGMKSYVDAVTTAWTANAVTQANQITGANAAIVTANSAVVSYVNTLNTAMASNVAGANAAIITANSAVVSYVNTLNTAMASNVAGANAAIVTANTGMKSYVDGQVTTINSSIQTLNANVGAYEIYANANIGTATTNITTLFANAATQQTQITSLYTNANANTAAYLSTGISTNIVTTGNVSAGNVIATTLFHGNVVGTATGLATAGTTAAGTFLMGQVNIPAQTIPKNTASVDVTVTVTGLTTSHKVIVTPAADLNAGIFVSAGYPSSSNTLGIQLQNTNAGGITTSAFNLTYIAWV